MVKARSCGDKVVDGVILFVVVVLLLFFLYPLWYILMASFSDVHEIVSVPFLLWVKGFTTKSYELLLETGEVWSGFINSFIYLVSGTTLNIAMTLLAAYPLSKKTLPGRRWMTKVLVLTMYISGGMIPSYLIVDSLGLRNTVFAMIIPNAMSAYYVIIAISFLQSVPDSILEAASMDGCSHLGALIKIVIPLSLPMISALAFQYGLAHWNSYTQALIYLDERKLFPLQLVLREILIKTDSSLMLQMTATNTNVNYNEQVALKEGFKYVSMVVSSVPLLVVSPFLKKFFAKGLVVGGVKE